MVNREQFEEATRVSAEISAELRRNDLTAEQRAKLELHQVQLAGALLRPWFPFSWGRRVAMLVLLLLGMLWPLGGSAIWSMAWVVMMLFSPRVVGEVAFALGRFSASSKGRGA